MRSHQSLPLTCPFIRRYAPPSPDRWKAFVSAVFSLSHMITLCAKGLLHIIWCNSPFCIYAIFIISYHWIARSFGESAQALPVEKSSIIASQEISATFKQHICDMQFADVACALKTQTAIDSNLQSDLPAGKVVEIENEVTVVCIDFVA